MSSLKTVEKAYCPECGSAYAPDSRVCPNDGSRLYSYRIAEDEDAFVGETLDERFLIESVIGEGGMGRVYRGVQLSVERPVAIKVLRRDLIEREDVIQRFLREARVISGFKSPNIVNLVDFGQDGKRDLFYLAMELLDGLPLSEVLVRGRLHPNLVCEIIVQVCKGLAEAHSHGVVHRDLKPDNIMLVAMSDGSVQVKVLDFGIAHAVQGGERLTSTGQVFGTAHYMAPEQASGQEVDARTDVYSLGCIIYELLSGALPFDSASVMSLLVSHVQKPPPPLSDRMMDDDVPPALVELTMQMLEKAPDDRPQDVLQVRDAVEAIGAECGFGPVRVPPELPLHEGLRKEWLRGHGAPRVDGTSDPLEPKTGGANYRTEESLGTAETAAHPSTAPGASDKPDQLRASTGRDATDNLSDGRPNPRRTLPLIALVTLVALVVVLIAGVGYLAISTTSVEAGTTHDDGFSIGENEVIAEPSVSAADEGDEEHTAATALAAAREEASKTAVGTTSRASELAAKLDREVEVEDETPRTKPRPAQKRDKSATAQKETDRDRDVKVLDTTSGKKGDTKDGSKDDTENTFFHLE